jgi:two-component system chemotaxis response regulator CheY
MRALVVDDHLLFRNLLNRSLVSAGVGDVDMMANGADAQRSIESSIATHEPYGLIFLDWHMPGCSGLQLLRLVRAQRAYDATPVVMLTAETKRDRVIEVLRAGATTFITKPISATDLDRRVNQLIGLRWEGYRYDVGKAEER